jgi:hypothetical protein
LVFDRVGLRLPLDLLTFCISANMGLLSYADDFFLDFGDDLIFSGSTSLYVSVESLKRISDSTMSRKDEVEDDEEDDEEDEDEDNEEEDGGSVLDCNLINCSFIAV